MDEGFEGRIRGMERKMEMKEREERRKNVIIKDLRVEAGRRREAVEELLEGIGAKVEIQEVRRIKENIGRGTEMVCVKLGKEEQKKVVIEKKSGLRGRKERIMEDWTWRERKMRWRLEEIARMEEEKGNRVRIGYGRIRINDRWWRWDEVGEVLRDEKWGERQREQGEDR